MHFKKVSLTCICANLETHFKFSKVLGLCPSSVKRTGGMALSKYDGLGNEKPIVLP